MSKRIFTFSDDYVISIDYISVIYPIKKTEEDYLFYIHYIAPLYFEDKKISGRCIKNKNIDILKKERNALIKAMR